MQVHIIVGIGDFSTNLPGNMKGVMADTAASPNDPIFINHHGMVDCILEEWLKRNPDAVYPDVPSNLKGHQKNGTIVPFFPVFKHNDHFQTADNFGYSCELTKPAAGPTTTTNAAVFLKPPKWVLIIGALLCMASFVSI